MPLRGLPVGVKDIFDTADLPTAYGSPIYAGHRPMADAATVALMRRAGGIVLGKTVTTEFAFLDPAGTRNPHNPAHTPGGSSSGSAAAVAAGMLPIAVGSQTGGSVIRPAAFCGVAGYKPSFKLLPMVGCRLRLVARHRRAVCAPASPMSPLPPPPSPARSARRSRRPLRRASRSCAPIFGRRQRRDAGRGRAGRARREPRGAGVEEVPLPPIFEDAFRAHGTIQDYEAFRALAYEYDHHRDRLGPILRELLDTARDHRRRLRRRAPLGAPRARRRSPI